MANKYRNDCVHIIQWRKEWREQVECAAESCAQNWIKDVINTVSMTIFRVHGIWHIFVLGICLLNDSNSGYIFIYLHFLLTTSHSRTQIIMYVGEIFRSFDNAFLLAACDKLIIILFFFHRNFFSSPQLTFKLINSNETGTNQKNVITYLNVVTSSANDVFMKSIHQNYQCQSE